MLEIVQDEQRPVELEHYWQGLLASEDAIKLSCYLKTMLPLKYQKMMAFDRYESCTASMRYPLKKLTHHSIIFTTAILQARQE